MSKKTEKSKVAIQTKEPTIYSKMQQMREKYIMLFSSKEQMIRKESIPVSEKEMEIIEHLIDTIEEQVKIMQNLSQRDIQSFLESAEIILQTAQQIKDYPLTIEQAEKLSALLAEEKLTPRHSQYMHNRMNWHKKSVTKKLAEAIEKRSFETDDLEELKQLRKKLQSEMFEENPIAIGGISIKIDMKIRQLQTKKAMDKIKNDISADVEKVIRDLADDTIDIEEAKKIIKEEARKKIEKTPKSVFSLTEKQYEEQVRMQIRKILRENGEKYEIVNPKQAIQKIQALSGGNIETSIATVIGNMISRKQFYMARNLCDELEKNKDEKILMNDIIKRQRKEIRNAEISDLVLKGIRKEGTIEEENAYFDLIKKGLEKGKVPLQAISLGKSKDGIKNITLLDIWPDEIKQEKKGNVK